MTHHSLCTPPSPKPFKFRPFLSRASKSDPITLDDNDDDSGNLLVEEDDEGVEESDSLDEDGVCIEVMKLEKNSRRIQSSISIDAPLDAIWSILTDYEKLADYIPGLAVSQLLQKGDNYARLLQIGEQNLAFGIKFNAKGIVDCFEKELETLPSGIKREIEFKMIEGDFRLFEGKWSILQSCEESQARVVNTTLTYIVDVKPKRWLPVRLVE
ncbi:START-like domain superfamily, partial [Sesbania bispinosa]